MILDRFRNYRLMASAGLLLLVLSAYAAALLLGGVYWTPFFKAQSSSVIFSALVFIGVGVLLVRRGVPDLETFSISLATTLSAIWLYELIYHSTIRSFPTSTTSAIRTSISTISVPY